MDKSYIKPRELIIKKFRNFKDVTMTLGNKITVISGQNGSGKSNILSLIASGSGVGKKAMMGSNFQPEFSEYFNIDQAEQFDKYELYLKYFDGEQLAITKKLSFKDDSSRGRGIRIIPRTSKYGFDFRTLKDTETEIKEKYGIGGAARVNIPTIYLSLSRLYPLGENTEQVTVKELGKRNALYQENVKKQFAIWYNFLIPDSISNDTDLEMIEKKACPRTSLHMQLNDTPTLSQSVGQDNIGNIISAFIDVYLLSKMPDYKGALICIDEIDVSLHPATQLKLFELMKKLAEELSIQFVVSSHSLVFLEKSLKLESKNSNDYSTIYLENRCAPYVSKQKDFYLLKADMFGDINFLKPKTNVYFEDEVGKKIFDLLVSAFTSIAENIDSQNGTPKKMRNFNKCDYAEKNKKILDLYATLKKIIGCINEIPTKLGCENLFSLDEADDYFHNVIIILDGDARLSKTEQRPKIADYLDTEYKPITIGENNTSYKLNERQHPVNVCFLPGYFAPESYIYRIIRKLTKEPLMYDDFWKSANNTEKTALYTTDKIKELINVEKTNIDNDQLKTLFNRNNNSSFQSDLWQFSENMEIVRYYYSDYLTIEELMTFITDFCKSYSIVYPKMIQYRSLY